MPEALAILAVFGVAGAAYVSAWLYARDPANHKPHEERVRLDQRHAWLNERLQTARRENWSADMVSDLTKELDAISLQREQHEQAIPQALV